MSRAYGLDGLPKRIAAVRQKLGLSRPTFAARVGASRNVVARWEAGKHGLQVARLDRIAKLGGVSVDWLLRGERRPAKAARREPAWAEAVMALRAVWREPSHRSPIVTLLRVLARKPRAGPGDRGRL